MAKRQIIEIPGVSHGTAPIPMGAKIGSIVYSSAINGADPETGKIAEDGKRQVQLIFQNIETFMKVAGGTPDNIVRMSVYLKDNSLRETVNEEWLKMFPDPHDRPARHISIVNLNGALLAQIEIVAVLE